eukprot:5935502-Pyramimonas_sp.AAC.1
MSLEFSVDGLFVNPNPAHGCALPFEVAQRPQPRRSLRPRRRGPSRTTRSRRPPLSERNDLSVTPPAIG